MTYNQIIATLQSLLESHAMIKTVKNETPGEWLNKTPKPVYPVSCFFINSGTFSKGREQVYEVQFFFLDKTGTDRQFEPDVISDQVGIGYDIVEMMRGGRKPYTVDDNVTFNTISDGKYEDYLAGCSYTLSITTQSDFDGCDAPIV
jgi:hypothetical protein